MQKELIQCNTEVAMETLGRRQILTPNGKHGGQSVCFVKPKIVEQLEENAKATQTWLNVWQTWATEREVTAKIEEYKHEQVGYGVILLNI